MSEAVEPANSTAVQRRRFLPSAGVFFVVAIGIYLTSHLAIVLIQHIVMPVLAVVIAGYLATKVYRLMGHRRA